MSSEPMAYKTLNKINAIMLNFLFKKKTFLDIKNQTVFMQCIDSAPFWLGVLCMVS